MVDFYSIILLLFQFVLLLFLLLLLFNLYYYFLLYIIFQLGFQFDPCVQVVIPTATLKVAAWFQSLGRNPKVQTWFQPPLLKGSLGWGWGRVWAGLAVGLGWTGESLGWTVESLG